MKYFNSYYYNDLYTSLSETDKKKPDAAMSFLSSMQQYVTSGISSLGLGNRRFSLSRQESSEQQSGIGGATPGGLVSGPQQQQQQQVPFPQQQLQQQQSLPQQQQQQQLLLQQAAATTAAAATWPRPLAATSEHWQRTGRIWHARPAHRRGGNFRGRH